MPSHNVNLSAAKRKMAERFKRASAPAQAAPPMGMVPHGQLGQDGLHVHIHIDPALLGGQPPSQTRPDASALIARALAGQLNRGEVHP